MQKGGCHPVDGCQDGDPFGGAEFDFLAANVVESESQEPLFPPYAIERYEGGAKVAYIGMTLEGTPTIVTPEGVAGYDFLDEADTANALVRQLKRHGVRNIVVLLHEGGVPVSGSPYDGCTGISGPIVDIAERLDSEIDAVISGHTHQAYNCVIDGIPVTSAASFGRLVTDMDLTIDRRTKRISQIEVDNQIVTRDVPGDAAIDALIARYDELSAPLANRVIGSITADLTRTTTPAGESALGDVIADAQLAATRGAGAQVALTNPGGIRADLPFAPDGVVSYGEAFTVQPFGNIMQTVTLTGAQLQGVLEQQWQPSATRFLQISSTLHYAWSQAAPTGAKVSDVRIDGVPVDPAATYRVSVNNFLAAGGDGFTGFTVGTDVTGGPVDLDALLAHLAANPGLAPPAADRVTVLP
jgi:5'-nucleotidase